MKPAHSKRELHSQVVQADRYGHSPDGEVIVMVASSIGYDICGECDHIHIWLMNDAGEHFATATVALDGIEEFCKDIQDLKAQILARRH